MIYKNIFQLSGYSNHEITKRLGITHTFRQRFEKSKKIDLETIVRFSKALNISQTQCAEIVQNEIRELFKN